jgi:hypothetical protein
LTQRLSDGKWITASSELEPDERILTQFASGQSISRVEKIERGS